jgi:DNA-binding NarL/FixJ family response regulator
MKPKILFVDDEQNILDSLRLSLRNMRGEWDMTFALGGRAALDALAQSPHDVVVSDMRMPGMDGAELLKTIQNGNPEMARIILSGYSDRDGVLKNICLAHQYLGKPCRTQDLVQAINKALHLHGILACQELKRLIARIETLPALPSVYTEMVEALADENAPLKRIGDILARDMALTASVLRVVNCPFFGFSARVSNIHQAVTLLGTQTLRTLVLSTHLFSTLEGNGDDGFSVRLLWDHSTRVAGFAKSIAEKEGSPPWSVTTASLPPCCTTSASSSAHRTAAGIPARAGQGPCGKLSGPCGRNGDSRDDPRGGRRLSSGAVGLQPRTDGGGALASGSGARRGAAPVSADGPAHRQLPRPRTGPHS